MAPVAFPAIDPPASEAIHSFFKLSVDVYQIIRMLYLDDLMFQSEPFLKRLACLTDAVSVSARQLQGLGGQAGHDLLQAGVKIALDLCVHLDRFDKFVQDPSSASGQVELRGLWSLRDIDALGIRLEDVAHRWPDILSKFNFKASTKTIVKQNGSSNVKTETRPLVVGMPRQDQKLAQSTAPIDLHQSKTSARLTPSGLIQDFILESLAYKSMQTREDEVTKAHSQTLEWIFDDSPLSDIHRTNFRSDFTNWLRTSNLGPIYWVTGKPGSGKSTFMRFLSQNRQTYDVLHGWAGDRPVYTAGFFFWTSGSREQRSQTGLLRYLLHQMLSSNTDLMSATFPDLWGKLQRMSTKERINFTPEWTVEGLQSAFHCFLDAALPTANICLFIDGIDEFEGDHVQIINFFKSLSARNNGHSVKMCLSSRPWQVFEDAFQDSVPNARIQDLSYQDMYRYAHDSLRGNKHVRRLFKKDAETGGKLVSRCVSRADGVFLWVRLAIERMLLVFQPDHTFENLGELLDSLPTKLDDLFAKLLFEDQTSSQISQTAILFRLICAREQVADFIKDESSAALTIWELAFSLFQDDDVLALKRQIKEATDDEIYTRCKETTSYVRDRFAGLLSIHHQRHQGNKRVSRFKEDNSRGDEARSMAECKLAYIHRTVRDWLMDADGAGIHLCTYLPEPFDPHLRLLRCYILRLKFPVEEIEHHRRLDEWYPDIALAMSHARYISNDLQGLGRKLVNEMDKTISYLWSTKRSDPYDHWARSTFGSYEVRMKAPPIQFPFLCLAIKFGLLDYVCQELELQKMLDVDEDERGRTPLLSYATEFLCTRNKTIFPLSSPRLIQHLLQNPSSINPGPNHQYTDFNTRSSTTTWLAILRHLRDAKRREWIEFYDIDPEGTKRWTEILKLLIEDGADVNAVVVKDAWDMEINALGVMDLLDETYGDVEIRRIKDMLREKMEV